MTEFNQVANIKVFGVGGGGSNAVNRMVADGVKGVDFYICNTDVQVMKNSPCDNKIVLGKETTKVVIQNMDVKQLKKVKLKFANQ